MLKDGIVILLDGIPTKIYLCNRKDKCNKSKYCGNACKFTQKEEYREAQILLNI